MGEVASEKKLKRWVQLQKAELLGVLVGLLV